MEDYCAPLNVDERYWIDRRPAIIDALAAEGLEIRSNKDRVWLHRLKPDERERAARIAENYTRAGRDWVPNSLWDNITKGIAAAIRGDCRA